MGSFNSLSAPVAPVGCVAEWLQPHILTPPPKGYSPNLYLRRKPHMRGWLTCPPSTA